MKKQIAQWFENGCDYYDGVSLYNRYGKSKNLKKHFVKGENPHKLEKLKWELHKVGNLPESVVYQKSKAVKPKVKKQSVPPPQMKECINCGKLIRKFGSKFCSKKCRDEYESKQNPNSGSGSGDPDEEQVVKQTPTPDDKQIGKSTPNKYKIPLELLPEILQGLIREKGKLYNDRAVQHKKLDEVPEKNDLENITTRKEITEAMNSITDRIDQIYNLIRFYEDKVAIDKPVQDDLDKYNTDLNGLTGAQASDPTSGDKKDGIENLSEGDLHKKRSNLRSSLSKDKKKVEGTFGLKKDKQPVPMPDGPKREKIVTRIKEKEEQIKLIEEKLTAFVK